VTNLRVAAGLVFALDLAVLALMVAAEFGDPGGAPATGLTGVVGAWLAFAGIILALSWWRESRLGLWVALVCGALPLLWVWSVIVQNITEWAATRQ
jgi:hypothetical protein